MCGIAGFLYERSFKDSLESLIMMMYSLQHRGQEAFGISFLFKEGSFYVMRSRQQLFSVFLKPWGAEVLKKEVLGAVGHLRYSTTGQYNAPAQPVLLESSEMSFVLAFNGTIANFNEIESSFAKSLGKKVRVSPALKNNDSVVLAKLLYILAKEKGNDIVEALKELPYHAIGGYSIVLLTNEPRIVVARDPYGFRPLFYSDSAGLHVASENPPLELIGINSWKEAEPGEIVSYNMLSIEKTRTSFKAEPSPCLFEYVYFSRPDSFFNGVSIYKARLRMGELLARHAPAEGDIIVPVPESGRIIALGYSRALGIPLEEGIIVNKYIGRGFIAPPIQRPLVTKIKYNIVGEAVKGKSIVIVDDSIVRGTTMRELVPKLKSKGAKKVHVRIASPPYTCPCYMGIDVPTKGEVLAKGFDEQKIGKMINADSLVYNTLENLISSTGLPKVCHACFSCRYPFIDRKAIKYVEGLKVLNRRGRH